MDAGSSWPSSVSSFTINGGTSIGSNEFSGCSNLTSITLNDNITSIGDYAFSSCNELTSITIPSTVQSVGSGVFEGCSSDMTITTPLNLINSSFNVGNLIITSGTTITSSLMSDLSSVHNITLPDTITSIEDGAFSSCYNLQSLSIPSNLVGSGTYYEAWGISDGSVIVPRTAQ